MSPDGFSNGFGHTDDFLSFGIGATGDYVGAGGAYGGYVDAGCAITQMPASGGVVKFLGDGDADNDEMWLTTGDNTGTLGAISDTAGSDKLTIFEARFQCPSALSLSAQSTFIGMSEEGLAAANTILDAGTMADKDLIGFNIAEAAPGVLSFVYRKAGQALQTPIAALTTLVAGTWYKVGFVYDPDAPPSQRITVYLDNVEQGTYVTATDIAPDATTGTVTFPDGEQLAILAGCKAFSADITTLYLDWVSFWQQG
jgi:hypothetical protein